MAPNALLALIAFAFVSSITPGPNNLMLMTSGVNFGFRRTIPHLLGIVVGFPSLLLGVGLGLGAVLQALPFFSTFLKIGAAGYMAYLAWRIAFSTSAGAAGPPSQPLTFTQALMFQLINPKGWTMALVAMAAYVNVDYPVLSVVLVACAFSFVMLPSITIWTAFGVVLRRFLARPGRLRAFNILMGLMLVATIWPMLSIS